MYMRPVLVVFTAMSLILGVAYPIAVTGAAKVLFPKQADGSLVYQNEKVVGSALLAQPFRQDVYFWGRMPSNAKDPHNSMASGGANLSASNLALLQESKVRLTALADNQKGEKQIPSDLITHSGSGLDPQIGLSAAQYQVARVAAARGWDTKVVQDVLDNTVENNVTTGFVPLVNVLVLNQALDQLSIKMKPVK